MRTMKGPLAAAVVGTVFLGSRAVAEQGKSKTYTFNQDAAGKPPAGWTFGRTKNIGKPDKWVGGKALGQIDQDDPNARYPLAVASDEAPADVRVSVKCKAVSGEVDQACGLVFRYVSAL